MIYRSFFLWVFQDELIPKAEINKGLLSSLRHFSLILHNNHSYRFPKLYPTDALQLSLYLLKYLEIPILYQEKIFNFNIFNDTNNHIDIVPSRSSSYNNLQKLRWNLQKKDPIILQKYIIPLKDIIGQKILWSIFIIIYVAILIFIPAIIGYALITSDFVPAYITYLSLTLFFISSLVLLFLLLQIFIKIDNKELSIGLGIINTPILSSKWPLFMIKDFKVIKIGTTFKVFIDSYIDVFENIAHFNSKTDAEIFANSLKSLISANAK